MNIWPRGRVASQYDGDREKIHLPENPLLRLGLDMSSAYLMNSTSDEGDTKPQHFHWSSVQIARFVLTISTGIIIVIFNILIIVAIAKYRKLRTWMNCLLLSMAVADLLVGVLSIPTHLIADMNVFGSHVMLCIVLNTPTVIIPTASILSLIAASLERLMGIACPLRYPFWVSRRRIIVTIVSIWVYAVSLGMLPILGWNNIEERRRANYPLDDCNFAAVMSGHFTGLFIAGNIIPGMLFLLCLNIKLFIIVKSQRRKLAFGGDSNSGSVATLRTGSRDSLADANPASSAHGAHIQRSRRVVFVLLAICHVTILCYIPVCVALVIDYHWFTVILIKEWRAPYELYYVGVFLGALNSMVNPIILGFANRDIRKHLKMMCKINLTKSQARHTLSLTICRTNQQHEY